MSTNKQAHKVQRFKNYGVDMMEWADGNYVLHSDYLALLDELEAAERRNAEMSESNRLLCADSMIKQDRIAELETREAKNVWSDIDMSDADCFTITRLHEIIYASELKWPEPKLLARFMLDVKQHAGIAKGE